MSLTDYQAAEFLDQIKVNPNLRKTIAKDLGIPPTTEDIKEELNNPYSLLRLSMAVYLIEVSFQQQAEYQHRLIQQLSLAEKTQWTAKSAASSGWAGEGKAQEKLYIQLQQEQQQSLRLLEQLQTERAALKPLFNDYHSLQKEMMPEWRSLQRDQIEKFANRMDPVLKDMGLSPLSDKDKAILINVAKAHQIQIAHPELIPKDAMPQAMNKAHTNMNINLMRIVAAKEKNIDPDEIVALKPSEVVNKQKVFAKPLAEYIHASSQEDEALAKSQQPKLERLLAVKQKIDETTEKISTLEESYVTSRLASSTVPQEQFLNTLELMYGSVSTMRGFEFKLTQTIKKLPEEEQQKIWQNMKKHGFALLNNADNLSPLQKGIATTALAVVSDISESFRHTTPKSSPFNRH